MTDVVKKLMYYKIINFEEIDSKIVPKDSFYRPGTENLFKLILYNQVEEAAEILVEDRFLVYHFNESKQTPLIHAIKLGHNTMAKLLVKFGSDVNWRDIMGRSPLYYAV